MSSGWVSESVLTSIVAESAAYGDDASLTAAFLHPHDSAETPFSEEATASEVDPPVASGTLSSDSALWLSVPIDSLSADFFPYAFAQTAATDFVSAPIPIPLPSLDADVAVPAVSDPIAPVSASAAPLAPGSLISGSGSGQADVAMHADTARAAYGIDGSGIRIGVLSDSFNVKGGMASDIANGYLPADTAILKDFSGVNATDEGRAMAQVAHDVAPGASIAFYTADVSEADFAAGILSLCNAGCRVIVDDVTYFDEPFFQNDAIAQAIDTAVAQGVVFLTSAGNDANHSYQSVLRPVTAALPDGQVLANLHDFGGSVLQDVSIGAHSRVFFDLQWDQPYGSAATNMEFRVYSGNQLIAVANRDSTAAGWGEAPVNPITGITLVNNGDGAETVQIAIDDLSGPAPGLIKYVALGNGVPVSILSSPSPAGTLIGHHMDANALTVGAAYYGMTPAFGVSPPQLEAFSSSGGTELLFDQNGNPLASPAFLDKVDVTAPDGVSTSVSGLASFFGTSAAAPNAAGVAALMLQANGSLNSQDVGNLMKDSAIDMAAPGYDNASGYGLIQADRAVGFAMTLTIVGSAANDALFGTHLNDTLDGGAGNDVLFGGGGSDTFVVRAGDGSDLIRDFAFGNGGDTVNLVGYGIDLLYVQSHLSNQSNGDQLLLPGGDVLSFAGISGDPFSTGNFLFDGAPSPPPPTGSGDTLVVHLAEDAWAGDAQFTLDVDGVQLAGPTAVTVAHGSGGFQDFTYSGTFGSGPHTVSIHFTNDGWGGTTDTDRNLYVGGIDFNGQHYAGETAHNDAMNGAPDSDPNAAEMFVNGAVTFADVGAAPSSPPAGVAANTLVVHLSEDAWSGDAQFTLDIDGTRIAGPTDVTTTRASGGFEDFSYNGNFGPGPHTVAIHFINDAWGGTADTDRNLYVSGIEFDGRHYGGGSAQNNAANGAPREDPGVAAMFIDGTVVFSGVGVPASPTELSAHPDQLLV